jgi:hypothetical protein
MMLGTRGYDEPNTLIILSCYTKDDLADGDRHLEGLAKRYHMIGSYGRAVPGAWGLGRYVEG